MVKAGLNDGTLKHTPKVDLEAFGPKIKPLRRRPSRLRPDGRKEEGKAYLEPIAAKPNIKKTGTGLLMETIKEGTGASPVPADTVKVSYKGTLIDGTVFDSSEKHGGPQTFSLGQVYKCWAEGLTFMKTGGRPSSTAPRTSPMAISREA